MRDPNLLSKQWDAIKLLMTKDKKLLQDVCVEPQNLFQNLKDETYNLSFLIKIKV